MLLPNQNSNPKFDMIQVEGILTVSIEQSPAFTNRNPHNHTTTTRTSAKATPGKKLS